MDLALPLLVTRVGRADDLDPAVTADHLAVLTDGFDAGLDLHGAFGVVVDRSPWEADGYL
jgi:hypothetical protein